MFIQYNTKNSNTSETLKPEITKVVTLILKRKANEHATAIVTLLTCIWKTSKN
jgi:hypothetical protein